MQVAFETTVLLHILWILYRKIVPLAKIAIGLQDGEFLGLATQGDRFTNAWLKRAVARKPSIARCMPGGSKGAT